MLRARDEHQSQCRQIRSERPAGRPATPRRRQRRPELEFLEDRRLLSTYYVQNTNDSGPGSLRWAIEQGNDDATPADIFFNIPASDSPLLNDPVLGFDPVSQNWTITLLTPLPVITNTVWIDGYTQAHAGIPFRYPNAISSAVQQVAVTGGPTGGTFTLTTSAPLPIGTATIPYDANAATVRAALGTIVGPGNVTVQGGPAPDSAFTIAFQNAYAAMDIPDLVAAAGGLTGGTNPGVLVETQIPGGLPTDDPKFITSRANARDPLMGYDARIRLIVDGSQLVGATGFDVAASHSILRGLSIVGFDVGVRVPAVDVGGDPVVGNLIQGNAIGDYFYYPVDGQSGDPLEGGDAVGFTFNQGNDLQAVIVSASNTTVGGVNPQEANLICGNGLQGVWVVPGGTGNQILGNQIGMAGPSDNGLYAQDGNGAEGILLESSGDAAHPLNIVFTSSNQIKGNVVSGNGAAGIRLVGVGAIRNLIQENLLGIAPGGGYRLGTGDPGNLGDGILLEDAGQNLIGGSERILGNAISSNRGAGVRITGPSATGNTIANNMIGVTRDGSQVLGNAADGVAISSADNTVGPGNVISQNLLGIGVYGPDATRTLVLDNFIGTDATGAHYGFGNAREGIRIQDSAANTIRGNAAGSQVISGNSTGVALVGAGSTGNLLLGNFIGTDASGLADLSNKDVGVLIAAARNTVGGTTEDGRNLISANHTGILLEGPSATGNVIRANYIGTDVTGVTALSNEVLGVRISGGAGGNIVGGVTADLGNRIAFHQQDGVRVESGTGNSLLSNSIWGNRRLGIDLVVPGDPAGGVSPNPVGPIPPLPPGPNHRQAYPTLEFVTSDGSITHIVGSLDSAAGTSFLIQFFTGPTPDPSGFGQGQKRLGSTRIETDAGGHATIDAYLTTPFPTGEFLTATATSEATGDTSEFARDIVQTPAMEFASDSYTVAESVGSVVVTVKRTPSSGTSTVNYLVSGGTATPGIDFVQPSGTLTFAPGESTRTFTVTILDDAQLEGAVETIVLSLDMPTGGRVDFRPTTTIRIIDNDVASSRIYYVTNTDDSGPGSLREAIVQANANPGHDDIEFAIPASVDPYLNVPVPGFDPETQTWRIRLAGALPEITDPVTIDGYTQAHFPVPYRYPEAYTATQILNMTGNPTGGSFTLSTQAPLPLRATGELRYNATSSELGLELVSIFGMRNVVVSGGPANVAPLVISFIGDYQGLTPPLLVPTVHLTGGVDPDVTMTAGVILKDPDAIASIPNTVAARDGNDARCRVIVDGSSVGSGATGFVLDTSNAALRGLIIDGFGVGVSIPRAANVGNVIQGNSFGTYFLYPVDPVTGDALRSPYNVEIAGSGNTGEGIFIRGLNTTVGGTQPQESNVVGNSGRSGILIDVGAHGNLVAGNQIGIIGPSTNGRYARVPNRGDGVEVHGSSNAVGGPGGGSGNLISANQRSGVRIAGPDATRNVIAANVIGLGPGGGYLFGTGNPGNGQDGVTIEDSAANQVGGPTSAWGNVISSNGGDGVSILVIDGPDASDNVVLNNLIGLTADGKSAKGNAGAGVSVWAPQTTIGPGNVISGNRRGVSIAGALASEALVVDNRIGTDSSGTFDLGNALEGVLIVDATDATVSGDGNGSQVISGNQTGVVISGASATRNVIRGNLIGSDRTGKAPIPNSREGVSIQDAPANTVGGTAAGAGNLISGNHWGVRIDGPLATGNVIRGNLIGTDITGTSSLGNEVNGVIVSNEASGNRIGGPAASDGNAIAFNVLAGVSIESGTGNSILTNRIWANGRLGIDLVAPLDPRSGVTPNEPGVRIGPNNLQNAPVLVTAVAGGAGGSIQGTLESTARSTFTIQFFSNQVADPSGFGQGQTPIGSTVVTTDDQGRASFSYVPAEGLTSSRWISATATRDDTGDTSEFSNDVSAEPVSLEFSAASWAVEVSAGSALIHVRRAGNLNAIVSVRYATSDGTAVAGKDYSPASGVLTFQVGQTDKTFPVTLLANPDQTASFVTVNLALADPTGGATIGAIGSSVLTIYNNLPPILQFKAATYTTYSTSPSALVTVTRGGGSRELAVSVKYACSGGTASPGVDYSPVSGTLVFQANQTTTTFSVPIVPGSHPVGTVTVGLVLQDPSSGAELGTQSDATLRIITSNVNPVGPVDATPPQVVGRQLQLVAGGIEAVVFSFSKPMDAVRVQDLGNYGYYAILAGPDGQFGTSDDGWVALAAARYDAASRSIAVIPSSPLPWNQSARIVLNELASPILGRGLADTSGNLLSGAGNGVAGGPYVATFCAGTQFTYPDSRGKRISLNLTGGGVCVVFRSISGDPQSVALVGATPRKSVLKLHAGTGGGRTTSMPPIQGAAGVRIVYKPPAAFKGTPAPRSASFRKSGVRAR